MPMRLLRSALAITLGLAGVTMLAPAATAVEGSAPARVAIVAPIVVPAATAGLISADALAQYTSSFGLLTRQLDSVINRPVTIGIDPMIIVSIRILGSAAPESAVQWLDRLAGASNETFALAYADSDLTAALQAGSPAVVAPESFDFAIDPALFAPAVEEPVETSTPTPTGEPQELEAPALPSSADLVDWQYTLSGIAWPRENSVVAADLLAIQESGYTATLLSSANVERASGAASAIRVAETSGIVATDAVSSALRAAVGAPGETQWKQALIGLRTAIAEENRAQSGTQSVMVATLERGVPMSESLLEQTLASLSTQAGVTLVPLSVAANGEQVDAELVDQPQPTDVVDRVRRILAAEDSDALFATVAEDSTLISSERRLDVLALLSVGWQENPNGWSGGLEEFHADSRALQSSVSVVESSSFNLLADRASLPITVSNELDQVATVCITLRAATGLLDVADECVELVIEPNSQARGLVPVQSVSNGTVRVSVILTTPAGVQVGQPTSTEINVQAGWETPIVLILAVLVTSVFAVGILRNILRRRNAGND